MRRGGYAISLRLRAGGPKARDMPAQGSALGFHRAGASPERAGQMDRVAVVPPFQGSRSVHGKPRALPWAGLWTHLWCSLPINRGDDEGGRLAKL